MFLFLKAAALGACLAFIVALFIGSGGSTGGLLHVKHVVVSTYSFYWSWPMFVAGTALSFGILLLMDD